MRRMEKRKKTDFRAQLEVGNVVKDVAGVPYLVAGVPQCSKVVLKAGL